MFILLTQITELAYDFSLGLLLVNTIPVLHYEVLPSILLTTGILYTTRTLLYTQEFNWDIYAALNPIPHPSICDPQFWEITRIVLNF